MAKDLGHSRTRKERRMGHSQAPGAGNDVSDGWDCMIAKLIESGEVDQSRIRKYLEMREQVVVARGPAVGCDHNDIGAGENGNRAR